MATSLACPSLSATTSPTSYLLPYCIQPDCQRSARLASGIVIPETNHRPRNLLRFRNAPLGGQHLHRIKVEKFKKNQPGRPYSAPAVARASFVTIPSEDLYDCITPRYRKQSSLGRTLPADPQIGDCLRIASPRQGMQGRKIKKLSASIPFVFSMVESTVENRSGFRLCVGTGRCRATPGSSLPARPACRADEFRRRDVPQLARATGG